MVTFAEPMAAHSNLIDLKIAFFSKIYLLKTSQREMWVFALQWAGEATSHSTSLRCSLDATGHWECVPWCELYIQSVLLRHFNLQLYKWDFGFDPGHLSRFVELVFILHEKGGLYSYNRTKLWTRPCAQAHTGLFSTSESRSLPQVVRHCGSVD